MKRVYCPYFDRGYAARGLSLIKSLRAVGEDGAIYVVCFDEDAARAVELAALPAKPSICTCDITAVDIRAGAIHLESADDKITVGGRNGKREVLLNLPRIAWSA